MQPPPGPPGGWGTAPVQWGHPPSHPPNFIPPYPGHPGMEGRAPDGVTWLRIFCGLQVAFHGLLVLVGVGMSLAMSISPPPSSAGDPPPWIVGVFLTVVYLPIAVAYVVGLLGPRRPWMYSYGIFLAVLSFMCGGCWLIGIPFLIFWMKPETKHWYDTAPRG
ncbi:MAG: hypothetical protein ACOC1F_00160 [Myxococcota bacterium]